MRLLSFFSLCCLLVLTACNTKNNLTTEVREPVYEPTDVPAPVADPDIQPVPPNPNGRQTRAAGMIKGERLDKNPAVISADESPAERTTLRKADMIKQRNAQRTTPPAQVNRDAFNGQLEVKDKTATPERNVTAPRTNPSLAPNGATRTQTPPVERVREEEMPQRGEALTATPTHEEWEALLQDYVADNGQVDYAGLKANKASLNEYLSMLGDNPPTSDWSRNEQMAYWINAYNAYTVKLIVDNYPTATIKDLKGGKPWDAKWINIGGQTYSLNNIEHDILRKDFPDARIHAVVNCAAASCPPLWNRAFTAANLDKALTVRTKNWVNDPAYNKISPANVQLSKLFDWYKEDFGDITDFLNKYYEGGRVSPVANVSYLDYDWALNKQ